MMCVLTYVNMEMLLLLCLHKTVHDETQQMLLLLPVLHSVQQELHMVRKTLLHQFLCLLDRDLHLAQGQEISNLVIFASSCLEHPRKFPSANFKIKLFGLLKKNKRTKTRKHKAMHFSIVVCTMYYYQIPLSGLLT